MKTVGLSSNPGYMPIQDLFGIFSMAYFKIAASCIRPCCGPPTLPQYTAGVQIQGSAIFLIWQKNHFTKVNILPMPQIQQKNYSIILVAASGFSPQTITS